MFYAAYVPILVLGLRKGELLGLTWELTDLDTEELYVSGQLQRVGRQLLHREPKTEISEAPLPLPDLCVTALTLRKQHQDADHDLADGAWLGNGLVFTTRYLALKRAIRHAEASDIVTRNVAALADTPKGQQGRPSKSLSLAQAVAVITAAETLPVMELRPGLKDVRRPAELMYAYIVLSLLVGVRTEEARALRWIT